MPWAADGLGLESTPAVITAHALAIPWCALTSLLLADMRPCHERSVYTQQSSITLWTVAKLAESQLCACTVHSFTLFNTTCRTTMHDYYHLIGNGEVPHTVYPADVPCKSPESSQLTALDNCIAVQLSLILKFMWPIAANRGTS